MGEIKFIDSKFISDEDGFKLTNNNDTGDFPERYVSLNHDSDHALKTIGAGSDMVTHLLPTTLADDGYFDLPAASAGFGKIEVGDAEENLIFTWARDNTVTLVDNSTNVAATDSDTDFCVFDNTSSVRIRNRLGAAKKILSDIHYTELPIAPTFQVFNILSGVDNLDPNLLINGVTVTPTFRYKLGDANATNLVPWGYGETLTRVSVATPPTYNAGSPGLGPNDDSCKFNESDYYEASNASFADVTTEDLVFEFIFKARNGGTVSNARILTKGTYYFISPNTSLTSFYLNDGDITGIVGGCGLGTWNHALVFINRDENSTNGGKLYVNGILNASANMFASAGTLTTADELVIGAHTDGAVPYDSEIAYIAMWKQASWHQAGAAGPTEWATIAKERFAKLCGYYPEMCNAGIDDITTNTRAFAAYLDKVENGYRKLYYVGSEWLRMCHRQDSEEENVRGYLPETAATNLIVESEDFLTTWTKYDAGDTVLNDQVVCPDGRTKAGSIAIDASDSSHYILIDATLTAATHAFSVFVKPGSDVTHGRDWCYLRDQTLNVSCYFDIANGTVGTETGACTGYIEGPFYSGDSTPFYRCCIVFTGTAEVHSLRLHVADSDGDQVVNGDGSTPNLYFWGAQCELGDYMTSPMRTDGGVASRLKDQLRYVAGANIGGEDVGQGSIYCDMLCPSYANTLDRVVAAISEAGAAADRIQLYGMDATNSPYVLSRATAGDNGGIGITSDGSNNIKRTIGITYETNLLTPILNGVAGTPDTTCAMPDDLDELDIGQAYNETLQLNGLIQNIRIYAEPTTLG